MKCTVCGKDFDRFDDQENFEIEFPYIGYGSNYDTCSINAKLCCQCFDAMVSCLVARAEKFGRSSDEFISEYDL
jgi:hypothetical protein